MTDRAITLDITPVAKPRMTKRDKWAKRPVVENYWAFKKELSRLVKKEKVNPEDYDSLVIGFHVPMPESWSNKKRARMLWTMHQQRPDVDNLTKAVLDSLYKEDSRVCSICAYKMWTNKGEIFICFSKTTSINEIETRIGRVNA